MTDEQALHAAEAVLQVERPSEGVLLLALNRPAAMNAINLALSDALQAALDAAAADDSVRAIVLTGRGPRAFSAGYDIREMAGMDADAMMDALMRRMPVIEQLARHPKPVIAALQGVAHGAGAMVALAADIRVAGRSVQWRIASVTQGVAEGTWLLVPVVGPSRAKELLMTARPVGAEEGQAIGLFQHVVDDAAVLDTALATARQIAAHPPKGPQAAKRLIDQGVGLSLAEQYRVEAEAIRTEMRPGSGADTFATFLNRSPKKD